MSKQIRPLTAYKKAKPELYALYSDVFEKKKGLSKKAQENEFYWNYAYFKMNEKALITPPPFFWKSENNRNNKLTITELGRLLLTGWYYNIEEFTKELSGYVEKTYYKLVKEGKAFNDMEIYKVVKHLRENIRYYYHKPEEAKYYLLESLFKKDLQRLLPPPPERLEIFNKTIETLTEIRKNQKAKGIDYWINRADELENYIYYLQEFIEDLGVEGFLSFEDWEKKEKAEREKLDEKYFKEIAELEREYKKQSIKASNSIKITLQN